MKKGDVLDCRQFAEQLVRDFKSFLQAPSFCRCTTLHSRHAEAFFQPGKFQLLAR
jgi:hypothetical protein